MSALVKTETTATELNHPQSEEAMITEEALIDLLFEIALLSSMPETLDHEVPNL